MRPLPQVSDGPTNLLLLQTPGAEGYKKSRPQKLKHCLTLNHWCETWVLPFAFLFCLAGYQPMKGDWVQAKFYINPTQSTTQAQSVAPLRYSRLDQVRVTSVYKNNGVVEDMVYFSLDSLLLPTSYKPTAGDLVNLVMVESSQSFYSWRALCMAPCTQSTGLNVNATPLLEAELNQLLENKGGLEVSDYGHFGNLMLGERCELVLWIQNKGSEPQTLERCNFAGWDSTEQFTIVTVGTSTSPKRKQQPVSQSGSKLTENKEGDAKEEEGKNGAMETATVQSPEAEEEGREVEISPGGRVSVVIACKAKSIGGCTELLLLHFSSFTIGRYLLVKVGSEDEDLLKPSQVYCPQNPVLLTKAASHVVTVSRRLTNFLPGFPVPNALRDCVELNKDVLAVQPCLGEVLSPSNMHSRFSTLLWLEELNAERELQEFTIRGALLRKGASYLHLEVVGLAEGRPNLNIVWFTINGEDVGLRVNSGFHSSYLGEETSLKCDDLICFLVWFLFIYTIFKFISVFRLTMRRCHQALELTKHFHESEFLFFFVEFDFWLQIINYIHFLVFQTHLLVGKQTAKPLPIKGQFFNTDLNPRQREAVKRILEGECRPVPYVLFGPPGTGKTITIIEAILQVYHFLPSSRVLVCTPSNSAADLICIRLHYSGFLHAASLARVNASCREKEAIPEVLQPYSRAGEDLRHAAFHRIVVSTCSSAAMFYNVGLQVGHFTHMFLDEAGQATEPESLIPISLISEMDGQIVLAGDPCQLGPIVKSKQAAAFGLGVSLLERLMANPLYAKHDWGYNPKLVTKLIYNYRSHEALLALPSKLFYMGELCFKAQRDIVDSLCQWKGLPKKGFPLLFHGVRGEEMRECSNPSWFNPTEAVQVMMYCSELATKLYNPVPLSDIGVIAPYRKQCEKIRLLLSKRGLSDIKVGSVEEFQGQEFLVIVLSTVRSGKLAEVADAQNSLGFLDNPKRFNVAVTRSKALLIVVGDPHILIRNPCFRALLQYCLNNGAYKGCDPPQ
uniref:Helicase ATP-binding domain-containing protein n=1 Tax=Cyprinodon variegatus TaxID=28743 RepID=A0A3Q2DML2_CYPVA